MKLTAQVIAGLTLPPGKTDYVAWDDDIPLFGLRLREGGGRTWILRYRNFSGRFRNHTIGAASAMTARQAREIATRLYARTKLGEDPAGDRHEARIRACETVELALRNYLKVKREELRPGSYANVERYLLKHCCSLHRLELAKVNLRTVAALLNNITVNSGPVESNNVRGSLEEFFEWASAQGLFEADNPVSGTLKAKINGPRQHVPGDADVVAIWNASRADFGDVVRLLVLTTARRTEIGGLSWDEIDLEAGVIRLPACRAKTNTAREIYLSDPARQILRGRVRTPERTFVFGSGNGGFRGWSRAKRDLDQRAGVTGWVLHDLRRYFSTTMNSEGIALPHIIEAALGHVVGDKIARTYNMAAYTAQVRSAMDLWGRRVMRLVSGEMTPMTVVNLRQRRGNRPHSERRDASLSRVRPEKKDLPLCQSKSRVFNEG